MVDRREKELRRVIDVVDYHLKIALLIILAAIVITTHEDYRIIFLIGHTEYRTSVTLHT